MLHSRHRWILLYILDYLLQNDCTGIHYADFERALLGLKTLPEKPILITIDDLTAVQGQNPVILEYFGAMKDSLVERQMKGSFAHITRPDLAQDVALQDEFRGWTEHGIALETHITPQVIQACEQAGLRFIVGIVNGRAPIRVPINTGDVLYVGRVGLGVNNDAYGAGLEIEFWREEYR